ncbi:Reverse transcriptase (RNA-dependent DNA polymerase) [Planctopirus ephydatiae]|uniref:RNA-directed DNA polymerase n=1 Tax=Planctopirus ephydatiae TaxID=2528019 RepID=A0A518GQN8_9PLAN|nr:reverse transcriptase family protein [Planctopirus ephydatiae]QDV30927.1 Reverse transcriptase (RNA-dependent DNA polymerase) [Planctopirus ephydatiae]
MGLWSWFWSWWRPTGSNYALPSSPPANRAGGQKRQWIGSTTTPKLPRLRYRSPEMVRQWRIEGRGTQVDPLPYVYARYARTRRRKQFLNLLTDTRVDLLQQHRLPVLTSLDELSQFLGLPISRLAGLIHLADHGRPPTEKKSHYWLKWIRKKRSGHRLIEAPKPALKRVQEIILRRILDLVPAHPAAHGFVPGCDIVSNAQLHTGKAVVVKFDLKDFYPSVTFSKVVAIFRSLGYSREMALWLARLTTSALPMGMAFPDKNPYSIMQFTRRHLPQGAPTSPALANLAAYSLDVRLTGLARRFGAIYTRYADDLTFSGDHRFLKQLKRFVPLTDKVIVQCRFHSQPAKRRILRQSNRQTVTGVVVNQRPNCSRRDYDQLKAILHNCVRHGHQTQNRDQQVDFRAHLQGRVTHIRHLNPDRGVRLQKIFEKIHWDS